MQLKRRTAVIIVTLMLLAGISLLAYPAVSNHINTLHGSTAIQQLQLQTQEQSNEELELQMQQLLEYNSALQSAGSCDALSYQELSQLFGGTAGYMEIPSIDLQLPVYFGVENQALAKGAGHLPGTPFPVGGTGNHSVLVGHTGLHSARLFTDLTELTEDDLFFITILGQTVVYQVCDIQVVLPEQAEDISPVAGRDLCTLVTCTPYGVNSHRLLITGSRVTEAELINDEPLLQESGSKNIALYICGGIALPVCAASAIWLIKRRRRKEVK